MNRFLAFIAMSSLFFITGCTTWPPKVAKVLPESKVTNNTIKATFYGASTIKLSDGTTNLMIDGFLSRDSLYVQESEINYALKKTNTRRLDAIFVTNADYDHALDAPAVSSRTGAKVWGPKDASPTEAHTYEFNGHDYYFLMSNYNNIVAGTSYSVGDFTVQAIATPVACLEPCGDETACTCTDEPACDCEEGDVCPCSDKAVCSDNGQENYSFYVTHKTIKTKVLIIPSANYSPAAFSDLEVDVLFLGLKYLSKQTPEFRDAYWNATVKETKAKLVVPIYYDNIVTSLKRNRLYAPPLFTDHVAETMKWINSISEDGEKPKVRYAPLMKPFDL
ncbi:MAG: MBL fold metallo-hydrolase [Lentisphaeria bacterium]|nr:MBL fold metallo-hydrolase [Lentisphaeria bacterium]